MGYRVEYGPVKKVRRLENRVSRTAVLTGLCFLFFCILVGILWPEGSKVLRSLIFPGDPVVTAAALEELTADLKSGVNASDSLRQFCLNILEGARLAAVR